VGFTTDPVIENPVTEDLIETILAGRAHEQSVVPVGALVFSAELLKACESNTCGHYNTCWTCPPASGTMEEQRKKILAWPQAFIFTTKYDLDDSYDIEGMEAGRETHMGLTVELKEKLGDAAGVYGAGSCPYCKPKGEGERRYCSFPDPCRFPEKMISSIEAAGINVTELSRSAGIKYNNGPNTVTYFSMVLF
jgi:predicted metal-binding protein